MLDQCRDYYKDNIEELNKIEEFSKTYKKEDAIYWYTTPTFVSKLINKALRTEDFHALYICRAYIADLSEQLRREYEQYKQLLIEFEQPLAQWTVYYGRTMSKEEIDILCNKKGQFLISLNGFLSTSRKIDIADCYSKEVIFIIQITFDLSHGCFAHVAPMSQFPQEDEVLFDLASVFKIVDMNYDQINDKWNIYLLTTDEGTNVVQAYINSAKNEANETNVDFIFARLLLQMGEYNLAQDYLTKLTTIISCENENRDLALTYYYKGLNLYREGNYSQSMIEYEKALLIQRKIFPEGHSDLGETLGGIGLLYDNMGKYELALEKHLEGLSISEKTLPNDHVHVAESLNNIGLCYDRMGKFELALEYDIRALKMKQRLFPHDHPDIATSLNNIGLAYYNHYDFEKALDYHQQSLAMKERCLPSDHPELAVSYCNLGLVHLALSHYEEALIYYMRDLAMSEKTLPSDHAEIGITHHNLGQVYRAKEQGSQLALKHYQKAIDIYMKSLPRQHPYIGMSLIYISEVLCDQDNLQDALQYAQEALDIFEKTLSKEHRRLAESAYILAKIYKKLNQNHKSLEYAYKAQDIQLKTLNINQNDVQKTIELINSIKIENNI
jgi:tetratricopeptide (TPR) repeat protein